MKRSELVEKMKKDYPYLSAKEVERAVRIIFEKIQDKMAQGGRVELRGFGSFSTRERAPRKGRNPRNGAPVNVKGKSVPYFRAGKPLVDRLNGRKPGD